MATVTALAPNRRSFVAKKKVGGQITIRKDVRDMTPQDVVQFRTAIAMMAARSANVQTDTLGFQYLASYHGIWQNLCQHGTPGFALWHRPYMLAFEQTMQDLVPGVYLPYWDWTSQFEIPSIFTDATWLNPATGNNEPNPLLAQPMNGGPLTQRDPGTTQQLQAFGPLVALALQDSSYDQFSPDLENPHNQLHGWVGGDMGDVTTAAFDPVFYAHHSFIEYAFCQWQDANPGAAKPTDVPPSMLVPWASLDDIWNYHNLGYQYEPYNPPMLTLTGPVTKVPTAGNTLDAAVLDRPTLASGDTVTTFSLGTVDAEFHRAEIRFEGLTPPKNSFTVLVFVNDTKANGKTKTYGNPHFLGAQGFFGHGRCFGDEGHCDPKPRDIFDLRPKHHYDPIKVRLNVTRPLRALLRAGEKLDDSPVTLVVIDAKGNEIPESGLHFEGFSLAIS
ncbi:MAG: tyrosinase [Candidatus Eremiobacteraeota bacterium]|jgi:tyrosinase|nr:tyrosinase [Candidatus Eremiobacteraeota bacterium]